MGKELAQLIGNHYEIFELFITSGYDEVPRYTLTTLMTGLADRGKEVNLGSLSRLVTKLENKGLMQTSEEDRAQGRPLRKCQATNKALRIVRVVEEVVKHEESKRGFEEWQIEALIEVLEDAELSEELRLHYSESFHSRCGEYPADMLKHDKVRVLIERVVTNPLQDGIMRSIWRSVDKLLPYALRSTEWSGWVLEKLYPRFVEFMMNKEMEEDLRKWASRLVGTVYSQSQDPAVKNDAKEKLFTIWFSEDTDPEVGLGQTVHAELSGMVSKEFFEFIKEKAKNRDPSIRTKAEILLKGFTGYFLPPSS
jgi:DNA-binding PadR family transcriptional regulator